MNMEISADLAVLGGGPGGYTAAFRAADLGLSVCLIEQSPRLGGVCLNVGCIPSKTLLHAASTIEEAIEAKDFGVSFADPTINIETLKEKKDLIINQLTSGLDSLSKARNINRLTGAGSFTSEKTISVLGVDQETIVSFRNCIIATGSHPFMLPDIPKDPRIWDSTTALSLNFIPRKLLIIGGGIIGLEMAQVYHALGSEITVVEMLDQLIPPADKDIVQPLFLKLKKKYDIFTRTKVSEIQIEEENIRVRFNNEEKSEFKTFDALLIAVGRKPNVKRIGLEKLNIELTDKGFIEVDKQQRTTQENIYAIGDVTGEPMLAHKATHQGKVAAEVISGLKAAFSPLAIPSVAYTKPEIAWMGLTEKEAKKQGIEYEKGKFSWGASGRALSSGAATGASKVLFCKKTGKIIGTGICGIIAGELIHEAVLALEMGADAEDISKTIHAHPTLAETFAFASEIVDGSVTDVLPPKKR